MNYSKKLLLVIAFFAAFYAPVNGQIAPPFWNEILAFKKLDSAQLAPTQPILFIGSSSITKWKDIQQYFPGYPVLNRGFGASTLVDQIRYAYDIIIPYQPKQVLIFCGENDLAYSENITAAEVVRRFKTLFALIRINLPETTINYISIKPSPRRAVIAGKVKETNTQIAKFLKKEKNAAYIDIYTPMLDEVGKPRKELFLQDSLHMTPEGYAIWGITIQPYLLR
jgi:lysophospholipase L1-like esterase